MDDPCYTDPSVEGCRSFRRGHMDIVADRDSLCAAMDFMVGCTLSHECTNGTTNANSTYCKPWSLVGDLCLDMPGMDGCEAWNALCGKGVANVTVVDMCKDPAPVPDVLTTMDAKDAVVAICTAEPTLDGCATCDFTLPGYSICKDYLTTLSLLCQEVPENENCSGLRDMCGGEGVTQAFPDLCTFL
ncbi:hypothetical protein N2152v2_009963 [Parachlorella kessleri]|uniref:Solute carrier family 31 n=1 Tax=Parachlorella kessleri TaxID=3074 RepID=A0A146HTU0_PARKE|nr:solute carrier family 31 [Parachlorella kessleri]